MKKLVGILSAALLVTAIVAAHLWLQLRDERARLSALQARLGTPQTAPVRAVPPSPGQLAAEKDAFNERMAAFLPGKEDRDLRRVQIQRMLPSQYPDLATELHLSPDEVNRVYELLATQQVETSEAFSAAADRTNPLAAEEARRKAMAAPQTNAEQLAALFGAKYPQWQEYEKSLPSRRQVTDLQAVLGSGANALGTAQARPLIAALSAERARISQEQRAAMAAGGNAAEMMRAQMDHTESNRRLLEIASAHLTPQQLDGYKRMLDRDSSISSQMSALLDGAAAAQAARP